MKHWLFLLVGTACIIGAEYLPSLPGTELLVQLVGVLLAGRSAALVSTRYLK